MEGLLFVALFCLEEPAALFFITCGNDGDSHNSHQGGNNNKDSVYGKISLEK